MPKTSLQSIVGYWSQREDEGGLSVDWAEAHERCSRCGYNSALQRCHIIPEALGGADKPANLVLLCGRCHREAPNVKDSRFMWAWIRAHATPFYDTFWTIRGMEEFEKMFGRKPFSAVQHGDITPNVISAAIRTAMESATIHFGEGRMSPSTIACVFYDVEKRLLSEGTCRQ